MKGKYRRRIKRFNPRFVALLSSLVLIIGMAAGATVAYLIDDTDAVVNTFTPAKADITVDEIFRNGKKEDVHVDNASDFPVYVRARVIINWLDENNNVLSTVPDDHVMTCTPGTDWTPAFAPNYTGYYYYAGKVAVNGSTSNLIESIEYQIPEGCTDRLQVEILAEAIQAEPANAVEEAWGSDAASAVGAK